MCHGRMPPARLPRLPEAVRDRTLHRHAGARAREGAAAGRRRRSPSAYPLASPRKANLEQVALAIERGRAKLRRIQRHVLAVEAELADGPREALADQLGPGTAAF